MGEGKSLGAWLPGSLQVSEQERTGALCGPEQIVPSGQAGKYHGNQGIEHLHILCVATGVIVGLK